jgi:hypothetical protein
MVKQNREIFMTYQQIVHLGYCVDNGKTFLSWYSPSLLRAFELAYKTLVAGGFAFLLEDPPAPRVSVSLSQRRSDQRHPSEQGVVKPPIF